MRKLFAIAFAGLVALALAPTAALADQVSGTSPADVLNSDAPAASPADVLGAQGAPAECPLGEGAAAPAGDLLGEAPEDAETREEHAAEIPGSENDPAADDEPEAEEDAGAADASAAMDDVDESSEVEPSEEDADVEQPLLLAAKAKVVAGWNKVGDKYYWHDSASSTAKRGWLVTGQLPTGGSGGLQRYWLGEGGALAVSTLVDAADAGWWAYARPEGYVVRGKYVASNGNVYLANNDGRLENPGWLVTSKYGDGLQRYYVDSEAHAAVPGYSADGWDHYTVPGKGYVARGSFKDSNGRAGKANNDGKLSTAVPKPYNGWVVANLGAGLQRYWFRDDVMAKSELLPASETGWWAYARPEGYVVRGKYVASNGNVYLANNDGRLENPGWLVTNKYGDGTQRYWIDSAAHAAVPGYSAEGWGHYTVPGKGYVARGKAAASGGVVLADNDGRVETAEGWLVTSKYDGHLQRYYMVKRNGLSIARTGRFAVSGKEYLGIEGKGYVLRGVLFSPNGDVTLANNDGVIIPLGKTNPRVLAACKATPSAGPSMCAAWVTNVAARLIGKQYYGNADELFARWCTSSDLTQLKSGMAIGVPTHGKTYMGGLYGHICIYVGDGIVMDNDGRGVVREIKLGKWLEYYGDRVAPKWGWIGGKAV